VRGEASDVETEMSVWIPAWEPLPGVPEGPRIDEIPYWKDEATRAWNTLVPAIKEAYLAQVNAYAYFLESTDLSQLLRSRRRLSLELPGLPDGPCPRHFPSAAPTFEDLGDPRGSSVPQHRFLHFRGCGCACCDGTCDLCWGYWSFYDHGFPGVERAPRLCNFALKGGMATTLAPAVTEASKPRPDAVVGPIPCDYCSRVMPAHLTFLDGTCVDRDDCGRVSR
jgi:hypothetical protein